MFKNTGSVQYAGTRASFFLSFSLHVHVHVRGLELLVGTPALHSTAFARAGLGENVQLNCVAEIVPPANTSGSRASNGLQWTRNGSAVRSDSRHFLQASASAPFTSGLLLVISNVQVCRPAPPLPATSALHSTRASL